MRRILVVGTDTWSDRRATTAALREVMETYQPPYTLITEDARGGACRLAAVIAGTVLGWKVQTFQVSEKCDADCREGTGHRRRSTSGHDYCPTARRRMVEEILDTGPDLLLVLRKPTTRSDGERLGQLAAKRRGIAVWERIQSTTTSTTRREVAAA